MELATAIDLFLRERYCGVTNTDYELAVKMVEDYLKKTYHKLKYNKIYRCEECLDLELQFTGPYCKNWKTYVDGKGCFHGRKICEYEGGAPPYLRFEDKQR